jgi:hypothetical protein
MRQHYSAYYVIILWLTCLPWGWGYRPSLLLPPRLVVKETRTSAATTSSRERLLLSRRDWATSAITTLLSTTLVLVPPQPSLASGAGTQDINSRESVIAAIRLARKALEALLDNWQDSVVDCNYADVPRELLETKNKEQLLEKASTFALFDKSVSVVTCKTSNKKIRDYLGRTGLGPLVGLNKRLKMGLEWIDNSNDDLESYLQATEAIQQALSRADSYSYTAGGDYSALNNFEKEDTDKILEQNRNLQQVRQSIRFAVENLSVVLTILDKQ